jgi:hypothetical protein
MLHDMDVAAIVKSMIHRDEQERSTRRDDRNKKLARRNKAARGAIRGLAVTGAAATAATSLALHNKQAESPDPISGVAKVYTVKPYDTEWGIAERAFPNRDPREVIYEINGKNDSDNGVLNPGERIILPPGARIGKPASLNDIQANHIDVSLPTEGGGEAPDPA